MSIAPGLQLAGFFEVFDERRTQVLGESEIVFMNRYSEEEAKVRYLEFFKANPPAVILAKGLEAPKVLVEAAIQTGIPLLTTTENTSTFISSLILFLNTELAPRLTRHGVLMEVYGEGMLIMGDSGVGKSETAVELIKRGHRLVAMMLWSCARSPHSGSPAPLRTIFGTSWNCAASASSTPSDLWHGCHQIQRGCGPHRQPGTLG